MWLPGRRVLLRHDASVFFLSIHASDYPEYEFVGEGGANV